jgi:hypothetical protein
MERLDFIEVAKLINKSEITEINIDPVKKERKWTLHEGLNKSPLKTYPIYLLYLQSDATKEAIEVALNETIKPSETLIIYAPSLPKNVITFIANNKRILTKYAGAMDTRKFLLSYIKEKVTNYLKRIGGLFPEDYVEPRIELFTGIKTKVPNRPLQFLIERTESPGLIGVLLGEPGQGKTHMSKYLAYRLRESDFIPIYINSAQWYSMHSDELSSLSKTITHSFRYFETPIGWIEGCEDEFLKVSLKAGLFRIIFDGFDEYILWNKGEILSSETLKNLSELASVTGSKILITSRTSFWNSEIIDQSSDIDSLKSFIYKIEPFDRNQAMNYFRKKLSNNESNVGRAISVFDILQKKSSNQDQVNLVGRGFILNAIADLVNRSDSEIKIEKIKRTVTNWIMEALCEREMLRQQLPIDAKKQLEICREIAEEVAGGSEANTKLLRFIIACLTNLTDRQLDEIVGLPGKSQRRKLADHPIIRKMDNRDSWEFVQEQFKYSLLAEKLVEYALTTDTSFKNLRSFLNKIKGFSNLHTDIANSVVDQLFGEFNYSEAQTKLRRIINGLMRCPLSSSGDIKSNERKLAASIALLVVNKFCQGSKYERTTELMSYFPAEKLHGIHFWGTISNMDFRNIDFKECLFEQVIWKNSEFDERTTFKDCSFFGGNQFNCRGFGNATWEGGYIDFDAKSFINAAKISEGKRKYNKEDLRNDLEHIIKKFMPKEGIFKSLVESNLGKGPISISIYRDEIISAFCRFILERHQISGTKDHGYKVKEKAKKALINYAGNKYFTDALRECYEFLIKKLCLD